MKPALTLLFCLTLTASLPASDTRPAPGVGQLGVPVTWIDVPGTPDLANMAQRTRDGRLLLTPNEAFFPRLGLTASGSGSVPDIDNLNGGKSLKSLWVGSCVEVPGPPHVQRTGPYPRVMCYRGWLMDASGHWHPLDQMATGNVNRATGRTHTDRGLTGNNWFYLQTGG